MLSLTLDYFIFVLALCAGVIQLASALSGLKGLLVFRNRPVSYLIGISLPSIAFAWFIRVGNATTPGDIGGVEGSEQFLMFWAGAGVATILTAVIASLTQIGRQEPRVGAPGMEGLRESTLLQLIKARLRK